MSSFSAANLVRSVAEARFGTLGRAISEIEQKAISFEGARTFTSVSDLLAAINRAGGVGAIALQCCQRRSGPCSLPQMSEVHPFTMRR